MDILIISNFCLDFSTTDNDRFFYIAKELSKNNKVEILTSSFYHITKEQRTNTNINGLPLKISFVNEPGYPRNVCIKRFYSHYVWGKNVLEYVKHREKPDVIYCAVPSLTAASKVAKYAKAKGIRFIIDIQDLWPEAFRMALDIPIISDVAFFPFKIIATGIYKRANAICGVSEEYVSFASKFNRCKSIPVYIGTELRKFDENTQTDTEFVKEKGTIDLAYCGSLSESYDIKCVIDALDYIQENTTLQMRFVVMGDGTHLHEYENYAKEKNVNALFLGRRPYDEMCAILKKCDIAVNPITGKSVASIINKHADYAACGIPVVNTQNSEEYRKLIEHYNMGINCSNGEPRAMALAIIEMLNNPGVMKEMGKNSRVCAEEKFNRAMTYKSIISEINSK